MTETRANTRVLTCLQSGDEADGFLVGERLVRGGLSNLYHCRYPDRDFPMVIKVPRLGVHEPHMAMAAFENEIRILRDIRSAGVPRVVAIGDLFRTPYYVMEYLPGDGYARAVAEAPIATERLCELGIRLARTVHDLHRHNVIHLDLNPSNVRTRADGTVVLIDFGLSHHARLPDLIDAAFGEEEGTTAYISPEQVSHVRSDLRSDIYAIGAMLYRYATGQHHFGRANFFSLKRRLHETACPPRVHCPALPPWLQEVILRCLERHPRDRYPTAKAVAYALSHPRSVVLTDRAHRVGVEPLRQRAWRWVQTWTESFDHEPGLPRDHLAAAPHVLVAMDLQNASENLRGAMRRAVEQVVRADRNGYVTVMYVNSEPQDSPERPSSGWFVELHDWARPLEIEASRIFYQVLPGSNPASAVVEYARHHQIDHIIVGARDSFPARRLLGSVSSRIVAEAPCAVTVIRSRREVGPDAVTHDVSDTGRPG